MNKKILLIIILPTLLLLGACSKSDTYRPPVDESEWLYKERGVVVASDFSCDYYVVETARGFSLLRNWGGIAPYPGSVMYGNFSSWGVKTFYNRSEGFLLNADVRDYWLGYYQAMDALQWNCGGNYYGKPAQKPATDTLKQ